MRHIRILHARDSWLAPMPKLVWTLAKHLDGIRAPRESLLTNIFMEGLMSVFSTTQRKARGYRSFRNLQSMLSFTGFHLKLPEYAPINGK